MISHWIQPIQSNDIVRITTNELSMTMRLQKRKKSFCFGLNRQYKTHTEIYHVIEHHVMCQFLYFRDHANMLKIICTVSGAILIARIHSISL